MSKFAPFSDAEKTLRRARIGFASGYWKYRNDLAREQSRYEDPAKFSTFLCRDPVAWLPGTTPAIEQRHEATGHSGRSVLGAPPKYEEPDAGPVDIDRLLEAVQGSHFGLDNTGFCSACGAEHDDCEPDTRNRRCDECGEHKVFGAEELLLHIAA